MLGVGKVNVTLNETKSVVIQSLSAWAGAWASKLLLASYSFTGNDASKYQVPLASPVTVKGLLTTEFGCGEETLILLFCSDSPAWFWGATSSSRVCEYIAKPVPAATKRMQKTMKNFFEFIFTA